MRKLKNRNKKKYQKLFKMYENIDVIQIMKWMEHLIEIIEGKRTSFGYNEATAKRRKNSVCLLKVKSLAVYLKCDEATEE